MIHTLKLIGRVLTFRALPAELASIKLVHILVVSLLAWLAGLGRWWDDPRDIPVIARAGLGSVIYVFALGTLLYCIVKPVTKSEVRLSTFVFFVGATAPLAFVYAVPIERWTNYSDANLYNMAALITVATLRVALLIWFLRRICELGPEQVTVCVLLPLSAIVAALTTTGYAARILDIMGGFREKFPDDDAQALLALFGCFGYLLLLPCLLAYLYFLFKARTSNRE